MEKIIIVIAICLALISPTGAGTLITSSSSVLAFGTYGAYQNKIEAERLAAERAEAERIAAEEEAYRVLHTYGLFERYDIEGYAIINVPETHFTLDETKSSKNKKVFTYSFNDISYIEIKYKTNITEDDIEHLGTNICGFSEEPTHEKIQCGDLEAIKLVGGAGSDEYQKISWCITKGKSALVIDGFVAPDVDIVPFSESVESAIAKTSIYYISKTVFSTPITGYWATVDLGNIDNPGQEKEDIPGETTENPDNTVGGEYPGTVATDKLTKDWKDMKFILDGNTLYVPCKMSDLIECGYQLKDRDIVGDLVKPQYKAKLVLYKDNGVTITVLAQNRTDSSLKLEALDITSISVNREEFGYYTNDSKYTKDSLPELILFGGITWDIKYDTLLEMYGEEFYMKEQSNADYKCTFTQADKTCIIVTDNYKNIDIVEITVDLDYVPNTGE